MVEEDRETVIRAGESFFIPKGRRCIWNQSGHAKKFMVMFDDRSGTADATQPIFKIDPDVKLQPSVSPGADMLLSSVPSQHAHEFFADPTGQFTVGIWDTTAYHRKLIDFSRHEFRCTCSKARSRCSMTRVRLKPSGPAIRSSCRSAIAMPGNAMRLSEEDLLHLPAEGRRNDQGGGVAVSTSPLWGGRNLQSKFRVGV